MVGKFVIAPCFSFIYISTAELYPTVVRLYFLFPVSAGVCRVTQSIVLDTDAGAGFRFWRRETRWLYSPIHTTLGMFIVFVHSMLVKNFGVISL